MGRINEHRVINGVERRQCSACKEWFPADEKNFLKNHRIYDGFSYKCRPCEAKYQKEYSEKHKTEARDYRKNNKERAKERALARKTGNPEKYKEQTRKEYLARKEAIAIKRAEDPEYDAEYRRKSNDNKKRYNKTEKGRQVRRDAQRRRNAKKKEPHLGLKICCRCGVEKELREFPENNERKCGYCGWCKLCDQEAKENKEREKLKKQIKNELRHVISVERKRYKQNHKDRNKWRKRVLYRDKHKCQCCGSKEDLQAHHLYSRNDNRELERQPENGITLCSNCHTFFHLEYGFGNNTLKQFNDFMEGKGKTFGKDAIQLTLM